MSILSCNIGYKLLKSGTFKTNTIRKLFHFIATAYGSFSLYLLSIFGQNALVCLILFISNISMYGCVFCGHITAMLEVAPNFSFIIVPVVAFSSTASEFLSTLFVSWYNIDRHTFEGWSIMFRIMAASGLFGCVFFLLFGSSDVESWDSQKEDLVGETEELRLKKDNSDC